MANNSEVVKAAERLWGGQSEENWRAMTKAISASDLKYYRIVFERDRLDRLEDLRRSYAELYDAKERAVARVPIFKSRGGKIEGATINLVGLSVLNAKA